MKHDTESIGEVEALGDAGEGVVRVAGRAYFVPGTLPGERVRFRLARPRHGVVERLEIDQPSPERVVPLCPIVESCGGCTWQHASARVQRDARLARLRRALPANLRTVPIAYEAAPEGYHYRSRARLAYAPRDGGVVLGFRSRASHQLVAVDQCAVLVPELNAALAPLAAALARLGGRGEVALARGTEGRPVASVRPSDPVGAAAFEIPAQLLDAGFAGAALWAPGASVPASAGDPRPVVAGGDGAPLWLAPEGFAQANEALNARLAHTVAQAAQAEGREVLELFAGAGNFTVVLARAARRVVAVEIDRGASAALASNVAARGLSNVASVAEDAVRAVERRRAEVVVLDPPRTGAREICELLGRQPPRTVVYVSCDPPTLGRDLESLARGMDLQALTAFEMFPQTPHLEIVATLTRRTRRAG